MLRSCQPTYLKLRPVHGHVYAVVVRPPLQIFLIVRVVDSVIKFFVNLIQAAKNQLFRQISTEIWSELEDVQLTSDPVKY